jgi:hypothetical protein
MPEPDEVQPGGAPHGRLRASHADRDAVINALKSAYVLGFVTKAEFDVRVSQTLTARTYAELAVVTADLPIRLAAMQSPTGRSPGEVSAPARAAWRPADRAIVACAMFAAVAFAGAIVSADGWVALAAVGSALASLMLVAVQMHRSRRSRRPGRQQRRGGPYPPLSCRAAPARLPRNSGRAGGPGQAARDHRPAFAPS